jgi:uncharacterized protein (DUF111 family)
MKKGRPAHVLSVLAAPDLAAPLRALMTEHTTAFGVRQTRTRKFPLDRGWVDVRVGDDVLPVKVAHRAGTIVRATPEFENAAALAARRGLATLGVLAAATDAAVAIGLRPGEPAPTDLRPAADPG